MPRFASLSACLRLAAFALLALGLCLQPVLAAMGETHEAVAHAAEVVGHAHVHADADAQVRHGGGQDDEGSRLHQLLHFAHCCGQGASALLPAFPQFARVTLPLLRQREGIVLPLSRQPNPHDRPPIAA